MVDLCTEGDRLLERGTGAVFNKPIKGVKVNKGVSFSTFFFFTILSTPPYIPLSSWVLILNGSLILLVYR